VIHREDKSLWAILLLQPVQNHGAQASILAFPVQVFTAAQILATLIRHVVEALGPDNTDGPSDRECHRLAVDVTELPTRVHEAADDCRDRCICRNTTADVRRVEAAVRILGRANKMLWLTLFIDLRNAKVRI
jgi:hypothetical protein